MIRPFLNGPRSLMRTTAVLPVLRLRTATMVPNGRVGWAAVIAFARKRSPEEVMRDSPYQQAIPLARKAEAAGLGTGFAFETEAGDAKRRAAEKTRKPACRERNAEATLALGTISMMANTLRSKASYRQ